MSSGANEWLSVLYCFIHVARSRASIFEPIRYKLGNSATATLFLPRFLFYIYVYYLFSNFIFELDTWFGREAASISFKIYTFCSPLITSDSKLATRGPHKTMARDYYHSTTFRKGMDRCYRSSEASSLSSSPTASENDHYPKLCKFRCFCEFCKLDLPAFADDAREEILSPRFLPKAIFWNLSPVLILFQISHSNAGKAFVTFSTCFVVIVADDSDCKSFRCPSMCLWPLFDRCRHHPCCWHHPPSSPPSLIVVLYLHDPLVL